ncbi:MAG TPA: DUF3857 domain-containing protein, partial [Verrucomicrobiae bacterium]|nr:DUF3857 domain-containing protein [Verrucomicrobiae bacterium]
MLKQSVNLLIVLVFAVCFRAGADESLISTNTTVVLVSGLPGDAESESAFHDQLQAWLGVVAKQHPEKCIVLCDSAEGAALPNLRPIKPDRDHFLELPLRVGSNASAVTVIIWGHGGQQGNAPVFHVRGPRITPEDVSAVCSKLPTANSQWLLMFKGSGAFGKALAGLGRQILSSDNSRGLGSDPVSLPLLARIVQQTPGITLKQLAQKVGPAVADWYAQRNLAQTEEPTLWLGAEEPRSVALGGAEPQLTTGGPELGAEKPLSTSSRENGLKPEEPDSSAVGFSQIQKVKPEQYPDADAVVLESRQICSLGTTPALVNEREEFIQVLKPEGKRYGDFDVLFSPPSEELEFLICEVLRPDGQVIRMDPQAAGISGERSLGDFQAPRRKFFSLPSVTVGAVLHVRYRSEWREYPLPRISMELPVGKELPVAKSTLEVRVPAELPFHYKIVDLPEVAPAVSRSAYSVRYSWQWQNVPADLMEPLAPPHRHAGLSVSTYRDWREFADWYGHISRLADEVGPELAQKALELTRDASSEREKVENIYRYVTGLRYVAIPLGINSVRPHAAARVLQSQFGDCKDKANLLNSLLH